MADGSTMDSATQAPGRAAGRFAFTDAVEAATAPIWAKLKSRVTPLEWRLHAPLIAEINRLKREKNAVILDDIDKLLSGK